MGYLSSLNIEIREAKSIFNLLDLDKSGEVTIEEFIFGLMRLKGNAKAIDTHTLLYENKRMVMVWKDHAKSCREFEDRAEVMFEALLAAVGVRHDEVEEMAQQWLKSV